MLLSDAIKKARPEDAPFPAGLVSDAAATEAAIPVEVGTEEQSATKAQADDTAVSETPVEAPLEDKKEGSSDEG